MMTSSATQKVFPIQPPTIIKYIIGEGGKNIKDIQERSKCKVSINSANSSVLISGETSGNVENGWKLVEETMRSFGWRYSHDLKVFQEVINEGLFLWNLNSLICHHQTCYGNSTKTIC